MRFVILGFGVSGQAIAKFLLKQPHEIFVFDDKIESILKLTEAKKIIDQGITVLKQADLFNLKYCDKTILSPGIPENHPCLLHLQKISEEVVGEMEFALRQFEGRCVGITGTNGKTTVTKQISHILNYNGRKAIACGNVGYTLIDAVQEFKNDILVIEISSFQLDRLESQKLESAVLLNITPDHLDRYQTFETYAISKAKIRSLIKPQGCFYIHDKTLEDFWVLFENKNVISYGFENNAQITLKNGNLIRYGKEEINLAFLTENLVKHDLENLLAAYAICRDLGLSSKQIKEGLETFKKPAHRIEFVKEVKGIRFFDDSKGTNIDAVCQAVNSMNGNILLIAGGVDKGSPYTPWVDIFQGRVKKVFAIGQAAEKIRKDLTPFVQVSIAKNLEEAVYDAFKEADKGENILLSPGCSSYDMFRDYAHRGEEFKRIVNTLTNEMKL